MLGVGFKWKTHFLVIGASAVSEHVYQKKKNTKGMYEKFKYFIWMAFRFERFLLGVDNYGRFENSETWTFVIHRSTSYPPVSPWKNFFV